MSLSWRKVEHYTILDAKAANWIWNPINVSGLRNLSVSFATGSANATLTVKFQWSTQEDVPDFSSAQSVSNMWDYIEVIDLEDWTAIDWDTWIALSWAKDYRQLTYNTDGLVHVNAIVSWRTGWEVTVKLAWFSNI